MRSSQNPQLSRKLCCFKARCLCANRAGRLRSQAIHLRLVRECCVRVRQAVTSKSKSVLLFQQKSFSRLVWWATCQGDKCVTVQAHHHARCNSNVRHNPKKIIRGLTFPSISVGHHRHQHADCGPSGQRLQPSGVASIRLTAASAKSSAPSPRVD